MRFLHCKKTAGAVKWNFYFITFVMWGEGGVGEMWVLMLTNTHIPCAIEMAAFTTTASLCVIVNLSRQGVSWVRDWCWPFVLHQECLELWHKYRMTPYQHVMHTFLRLAVIFSSFSFTCSYLTVFFFFLFYGWIGYWKGVGKVREHVLWQWQRQGHFSFCRLLSAYWEHWHNGTAVFVGSDILTPLRVSHWKNHLWD